MLTIPFRHCNRFRRLDGVVATTCGRGRVVSGIGHTRTYAKEKSCCPDKPQAEGKKIEPWPKAEPPPPAWRCECPKEPQPPNYDPYRIKVPDVVVPPIPTSNAKWTGVVFTVDREDKEASPAVAQQTSVNQPAADSAAADLEDEAEEDEVEEQPRNEGFFAGLKSYFGFGKGKKGGDEVPSEDGREPFKSPEINLAMNTNLQDLFHDSPIVHPDYWKDKTKKPTPALAEAGMFPRLGYHGRSKYKYAFHEPWKPLDRSTLIAQAEKEEVEMCGVIEAPEKTEKQPMLECAKLKGPCSVKPAPPPPPCPPPPPKPFPWIYIMGVASFFGLMGVIYQFYLWREEKERLGESIPVWRPRRRIKRPFHCNDLPACVQYLIVGAGTAGWAAYKSIMEHDRTAKVFFITKEDCLPYDRPPMSKHMWWNPDPPELSNLHYIEDMKRHTMYMAPCREFMDPIKFYRKKTGPAMSIATGWCVLRVDADDHVVWVKTMCGEQPIYYERCLIAPGSKPKKLMVFNSAPKSVREKVCSLRTIRDLEIAYRKVKAAKHVVIIGGGTLGCELAWHLGKMNQMMERKDDEEPMKIVHMLKDRGIMAGVLPEYLGEWAAEKIEREGVTVMPKTQVYDAFETPDGRLELTLSNGGSLVTDYVFVAVGTEPRTELAEPSFLELDRVNGGFKVNTELEARTHLYVAGDAASFYSQWKDTRLRVEHYSVAEQQGTIAGANMTGYWTPCNMEPHFWLRLGHALEMEAVGEVGACMPTVGIFKRCSNGETAPQAAAAGGDRPCYKKAEEYQNRYKRGILFYLRDETVVGMVFWNIPPVDDRMMAATEMLRARPTYKDINMLAELLGFPETQCEYRSEAERKEPGPCINNWRVF